MAEPMQQFNRKFFNRDHAEKINFMIREGLRRVMHLSTSPNDYSGIRLCSVVILIPLNSEAKVTIGFL